MSLIAVRTSAGANILHLESELHRGTCMGLVLLGPQSCTSFARRRVRFK